MGMVFMKYGNKKHHAYNFHGGCHLSKERARTQRENIKWLESSCEERGFFIEAIYVMELTNHMEMIGSQIVEPFICSAKL
uniref:Uncharacterized protein n=1 Tax=Gossypium raimondii TaxID=29730 RepID=A0A0D2MVZ2_GOSRA|nr:hypothetical protein B456_004G096500 [Gossypium raimondii]